jgi:shikimate kinase
VGRVIGLGGGLRSGTGTRSSMSSNGFLIFLSLMIRKLLLTSKSKFHA